MPSFIDGESEPQSLTEHMDGTGGGLSGEAVAIESHEAEGQALLNVVHLIRCC